MTLIFLGSNVLNTKQFLLSGMRVSSTLEINSISSSEMPIAPGSTSENFADSKRSQTRCLDHCDDPFLGESVGRKTGQED